MPNHKKPKSRIAQFNHRKQPAWKNSTFLAIVSAIAIVVVVALAAAILLNPAARGDDGVVVTPTVHGSARVAVDKDIIDYGDVHYLTTVQTEFKIQNVGDKDLIINQTPVVQVVEGCCPPKAVIDSTRIQPGHETTLHFQFMMHEGMGGKHRFNVLLDTNDPVEPEKTMVVLSNWIP